MNFDADLRDIIESYFASQGIRYDDSDELSRLAVRYFEMRIRRIPAVPRTVHFSDELHSSLGELARETDSAKAAKASEAWGTVFYLHHLFAEGESVIPHLSRRVEDAEDPAKLDRLLWDWGIHHLHLRRHPEGSGFVKRSDYLLFAIVTDTEAFFVDVRPHNDPENLLWYRQDLLRIVHSNWPELIRPNVLRGVTGGDLTDHQRKVLRDKNTNFVMELGGKAVAPLGGGLMADGSSLWCKWWVMRLRWELNQHTDHLNANAAVVREALKEKGMGTNGDPHLKLALLEDLNLPADLVQSLQEEDSLSKDLSRMGFVIVEATTRTPIAVRIEKPSL